MRQAGDDLPSGLIHIELEVLNKFPKKTPERSITSLSTPPRNHQRGSGRNSNTSTYAGAGGTTAPSTRLRMVSSSNSSRNGGAASELSSPALMPMSNNSYQGHSDQPNSTPTSAGPPNALTLMTDRAQEHGGSPAAMAVSNSSTQSRLDRQCNIQSCLDPPDSPSTVARAEHSSVTNSRYSRVNTTAGYGVRFSTPTRTMANTSTQSLLGHQMGVDPPVSSPPAAGAGVSMNNDISPRRSSPPGLKSRASADPPSSLPSKNDGADSSTDSTSPLSDITANHAAQGLLGPEHHGCTIPMRGGDPPTVSSPLAMAQSGCNAADSSPLSDYTQMQSQLNIIATKVQTLERSDVEVISEVKALEHLLHEDFFRSANGLNKMKDMVGAVECGLEKITKQMDVVSQLSANSNKNSYITSASVRDMKEEIQRHERMITVLLICFPHLREFINDVRAGKKGQVNDEFCKHLKEVVSTIDSFKDGIVGKDVDVLFNYGDGELYSAR